jgi:hypothetical protein
MPIASAYYRTKFMSFKFCPFLSIFICTKHSVPSWVIKSLCNSIKPDHEKSVLSTGQSPCLLQIRIPVCCQGEHDFAVEGLQEKCLRLSGRASVTDFIFQLPSLFFSYITSPRLPTFISICEHKPWSIFSSQ